MQTKTGTAILVSIAIGLTGCSTTAQRQTIQQQQADLKDIAAKSFGEARGTEEKQHKVGVNEQLKADKATCKNFGLKYGTGDFADCMMKLDHYRKEQAAEQLADDAAQQQDNLAAQQEAEQAQEQRAQEQRQAFITALANLYQCHHAGISVGKCLAQ